MNPVKKGHGRSHVGHSGDDKFDDMLVRLESLPTVDHSGGVGDAWCRARRSIRMIVRCGPPHAAKYVFQPGHISLTRGLQEVSNAESRLCNIMTTDDKGERRRRYGAENIVGIAGVAISAEGTYLKLIWTGIDKEHQHLCPNGYNWNRRTDLNNRIGKEMSELRIQKAWELQEKRFNDWEGKRNPGTPGRSPTPFPFDVFYRRKRGGSVLLQARYATAIKREETPFASTQATETATTPNPLMVTNRPGATSSSETEARKRQEARFNDWERGHPFASRYQTINIMRFPREVIDRICSFLPTLSRGAFLSGLNLQPWESDRQQMLLWSSIFKNDQWLTEVTEKDTGKLVLIGSQLREVSSREREQGRKEYFMTLCLLGGTGKIPTWEIFKSSLHEHTYDRSSDEIRFASGIRLNVQNLSEHYLSVLRKDPEERQTPFLMISNEGIRRIISFRRGKPYVQYSFYGGSCIQDLSFSDMTETGGPLWLLKLHDNGVRWTVILTSIYYGLRHLVAV